MERAAEGRVEEILLPQRDGEELVGLARQRRLALAQRRQRAARARVLRKPRARLLGSSLLAFLLTLLAACFLPARVLPARRLPRVLRARARAGFPPPFRALLLRLCVDALGRAAEEEAIGDAVLKLVGVGDGVHLVEAYDAVEGRDACDASVGQVRLDDVAEPERAVAVVEVAGERGRAKV